MIEICHMKILDLNEKKKKQKKYYDLVCFVYFVLCFSLISAIRYALEELF